MSPRPVYGSDVIVDLLIEAGIDHVAFNPGASFRGIHDSLVNHAEGGPRIVLCTQEGISVAVAHGYAKAAGKPMAALVHNVVGLQLASMSIYNAWVDRVPMLVVGGTGPVSKARRRPWIDWIHTASLQGQLVRDYVKWDDQPHDLASVPESLARALHTTVSAPAGPVYVCYDVDIQEDDVPADLGPIGLDGFATPTPPAPSGADLDWMAELLRTADRPLLVAGFAGETPEGFRNLVALAELTGVPVWDTRRGRFNFPTAHELNVTGILDLVEGTDVVVALDVEDIDGSLRGLGLHAEVSAGGPSTVVHVTPGHLKLRSWAHDYHPLVPLARHVTATAGTALAGLVERLRAEPVEGAVRTRRLERVDGRVAAQREAWRKQAEASHLDGAVSLDALVADVGAALAGERFVLTSGVIERPEYRLWDLEEGQSLGWAGGGGLGYNLGASIGASLALGPDVLCVNIQPDGDLLFTPGALWTAAHCQLPILTVIHNNRQYGNTVDHAAKVAKGRGRPVENRYVGTDLTDPPVDFAQMARSFGVWGIGPITDRGALAGALAQAVEVIRSGQPAVVDVVTAGY